MHSIHKVLLVNAGTDEHVSSIANDGTFPALGVVSLATALRVHLPELDVLAVDGQVTPMAELLDLVDTYRPDLLGVSIFYEAFDSMSSAPRWLEELAAAKPDDVGEPRFFVYTQASETTPRLIDLYRRIGVYRVNMGVESGDSRMLKLLKGPRDSLESNQRAAMLLKEAGMPIYGSLVLGGPDETTESLERTVDFARWLIDNDMMAALEAQPLYPEFTALTGTWLMNPSVAHAAAREKGFTIRRPDLLETMPAKYGPIDLVDFDEASMDWNAIFSAASWDEVTSAAVEIRDYARTHNTAYGSAFASKEVVA